MRFVAVSLRAPGDRLAELAAFYGDRLGLACSTNSGGEPALTIGETRLEFRPGTGDPFYHFALLVPQDRFEQALRWAQARTELLPNRDSGELVFEFGAWEAYACYFLDPAGNIVELIAHRGIGEAGRHGEFDPAELIGLSELGLVGDPLEMARSLDRELGLRVWDGSLATPDRLAFIGRKGRTLIVAEAGRGWLPTGRPAELHPLEVELSCGHFGDVVLEGSRYRVSCRNFA